MSVQFTKYRNVRAAVIDTGKLRLTFLPDNGGRLVSLVDKSGTEWMAYEGEGDTYRGLTLDSSYVSGADVCGMDDMFPTIDPENAPQGSGCREGVLYNDHGEISRIAYDEAKAENGTLIMTFTSKRLFYRFTKSVRANEDGSVTVAYRIENNSDDAFPFIWAGHCMLATENCARLVLPYADGSEGELMFDVNKHYGNRGDKLRICAEHLTSLGNSQSDYAYKFYYTDKIPEGKIGYLRGEKKLDITYDAEKVPYLGVWMNNGGFKGFACVAPEPCTAPFDKVSAAAKRGIECVIPPRGKFEFELTFCVN